jgi:hypothetical protein
MVAKNKISIEFDIEVAQELAFTCGTTAIKIDWVLENSPPKASQAKAMDERAKILTKTATLIEKALSDRAKINDNNVVKMATKK